MQTQTQISKKNINQTLYKNIFSYQVKHPSENVLIKGMQIKARIKYDIPHRRAKIKNRGNIKNCYLKQLELN